MYRRYFGVLCGVLTAITIAFFVQGSAYAEKVCPKCKKHFADKYAFCDKEGSKLFAIKMSAPKPKQKSKPTFKPRTQTKARTNFVSKMEMIYIPAGSFWMGNSGVGADATYASSYPQELPRHQVTLAAYSIGKYEVTRGEYRQFINANGYTTRSYWSDAGWAWKGSKTQPTVCWVDPVTWGTPPGQFSQGDSRPVVGVCYYEAEAFCNWAGGNLPTEAQWERAARWNTSTSHANVYPWGDTWDAQKCNSWDDTLYSGSQTAPVGSYSSYGSPSGCQDMAGNVWEWCRDWHSDTYYATSPSGDPQGPTSGSYRVLRGGGWSSGLDSDYRCAFRIGYGNPYSCVNFTGFRLVR